MISIDRKIASAVLRLTKNYSDEIWYDPETNTFHIVRSGNEPDRFVPVPVPPSEVRESVDRLVAAGWLVVLYKIRGGEFYFRITSRLLHRKAFWLDDFTRKFWGGFVAGLISGMLVTVIGELLIAFLRSVLGI